jgi:hypothetical protein
MSLRSCGLRADEMNWTHPAPSLSFPQTQRPAQDRRVARKFDVHRLPRSQVLKRIRQGPQVGCLDAAESQKPVTRVPEELSPDFQLSGGQSGRAASSTQPSSREELGCDAPSLFGMLRVAASNSLERKNGPRCEPHAHGGIERRRRSTAAPGNASDQIRSLSVTMPCAVDFPALRPRASRIERNALILWRRVMVRERLRHNPAEQAILLLVRPGCKIEGIGRS